MKLISNILGLLFFLTIQIKSLNEIDQNKLYLTIDSKTITATLESSQSVTYLKTLLPLRLKMYNYASLAQGYTFSSYYKKLNLEEEINTDIKIGDIVLFDYKHLMIFYQNFKVEDKYIKIGHVDSVDKLNGIFGDKDTSVVWSLCDPQKDDCKVPFSNYYSRFIHYLTWKVFSFVCFLLL